VRIAFLRGINVGGHNVKKDVLRQVFVGLGLTDVATFIASGNVIFGGEPEGVPDRVADADLEERMAAALEATLGWAVPAFVRSPAEIAAIINVADSATDLAPADGETLQVGFLHHPPDGETAARLEQLSTPTDLLRVDGRELYWLCRGPVHKSKLANARLDRTGGGPTTFRNITTMRRLVDVLGP
jgi:uncharacterized protein (DUF1697 family)